MCSGTGTIGRPLQPEPEPEPADLFQLPEVGGETDPVAARQRSDPGGGPAGVMPSAAASGSPAVLRAAVRVLGGILPCSRRYPCCEIARPPCFRVRRERVVMGFVLLTGRRPRLTVLT